MATFYQAMTGLPRHIEEKLLTFNILQLCALVSEKPGGPRWTGASDQYGPIKEIEKRWKLDDLCKRIEGMTGETPLMTYARVMQSIGGNPARDTEIARKQEQVNQFKSDLPPGVRLRLHHPIDQVAEGMAACKNIQDLKRVVAEHGIPVDDEQWTRVAGMKNFGLSRMWVGNKWRWWLRHKEKTK